MYSIHTTYTYHTTYHTTCQYIVKVLACVESQHIAITDAVAPSALDGRLLPSSGRLSRSARSSPDRGGRRRFGGIASASVAIFFVGQPGPQYKFPSRHDEPARSQGFPIPADNFPNELARVCDSVGTSPASCGLDAAFPSRFVMERPYGGLQLELGPAGLQ